MPSYLKGFVARYVMYMYAELAMVAPVPAMKSTVMKAGQPYAFTSTPAPLSNCLGGEGGEREDGCERVG